MRLGVTKALKKLANLFAAGGAPEETAQPGAGINGGRHGHEQWTMFEGSVTKR